MKHMKWMVLVLIVATALAQRTGLVTLLGPSTAALGHSVPFTVDAAAHGHVAIFSDGAQASTYVETDDTGKAVVNVTFRIPGKHQVTARYFANQHPTIESAPLTVVVGGGN